MSVFIREINVENLGPLARLSFKPARLNLIYGRNEQGKTCLVEFLIRSLFRQSKQWRLRNLGGNGTVVVALDGQSQAFDPRSKKKLEDFWEQDGGGLPRDFSKLLVVKGGELVLAEVEGGADKAIVKRFLSNREVLDRLESKISSTIRQARVENRRLVGPRRGEIGRRMELEERLEQFQRLFGQIDRDYSGGRRGELERRREKLQHEIEAQRKAKRHLAFKLHQELQKLEQSRNRIPGDRLREVRETLNRLHESIGAYENKQRQQKQAAEKGRHHEWLKQAHEVYRTALTTAPPAPNFVLVLVAGIAALGAGVFSLLGQRLPSLGSLAVAVVFALLYLRQVRVSARHVGQREELRRIEEEFARLFGEPLTGLPMLLEYVQRTGEDFAAARLLKEQLNDDLRKIEALEQALRAHMLDLTGVDEDMQNWPKLLRRLETDLRFVEDKIREKELRLAELAVDPSDFCGEPGEVEYSKTRLEELQAELRKVENEIAQESQKLASLKQTVCHLTGDDISANWGTVLLHLQEKYDELLAAYKRLTAEILGKMVVFGVLKDLRQAEDSKIVAGLKSPSVQEPLFQLTGRYTSLDLDGDQLVVRDAFHRFMLSELSTGAQEQVLLALRLGFGTRVLRDKHLFLILDDAFQHADWGRRRLLVGKMVELARAGWQVLYFTMDDHIAKLFNREGGELGDAYRRVDLAGDEAAATPRTAEIF